MDVKGKKGKRYSKISQDVSQKARVLPDSLVFDSECSLTETRGKPSGHISTLQRISTLTCIPAGPAKNYQPLLSYLV